MNQKFNELSNEEKLAILEQCKQDISDIQQELIEEIKKGYGDTRHGVFIIQLKELIGDHQ